MIDAALEASPAVLSDVPLGDLPAVLSNALSGELADESATNGDIGQFLRYRAMIYGFIDKAFGLRSGECPDERDGFVGAFAGTCEDAPRASAGSRYATYDAYAARSSLATAAEGILPEELAIDVDFMSFMSDKAYRTYLSGDKAHLSTILGLQLSFACCHLLSAMPRLADEVQEPTPAALVRAFCERDVRRVGQMLA